MSTYFRDGEKENQADVTSPSDMDAVPFLIAI